MRSVFQIGIFLQSIIVALILYFSAGWCFLAGDLKGFDENLKLKSEYEYLAPHHGFSLARQPLLTNIYNYPNAILGASFNSSTRNWHSPTEQLIQTAFSIPPGTESPFFLQVAPIAVKCAKFLGPSAIGIIIKHLIENQAQKENLAVQELVNEVIKDPDFTVAIIAAREKAGAIEAEMNEITNKALQTNADYSRNAAESEKKSLTISQLTEKKLELEDLVKQHEAVLSQQPKDSRLVELEAHLAQLQSTSAGEKKELEEKRGDIRRKIADLKKEISRSEHQDKLEEIRFELRLAHKELVRLEKEKKTIRHSVINVLEQSQSYQTLQKNLSKENYKPAYLKDFLTKVLSSWKSEGPLSAYPTHFTEQVLVAIAVLNTPDHDKRELLKLYHHLPSAVDQINEANNADWLRPFDSNPQDYYHRQDYLSIQTDLASMPQLDGQLERILARPSETAFLGFGQYTFDDYAIPTFSSLTVKLIDKSGIERQYPDCMDSSILNFLAIVARNPQNAIQLPDQCYLDGSDCQPKPELKSFLQQFDIANLPSQLAHDRWAKMVSEIEGQGVTYVNTKYNYEIETQVDNVFSLFGYLISPSVIGQASSRELKMNSLCRFFSRPDFQLDWQVVNAPQGEEKSSLNEKNTGVSLEFFINRQPSFVWEINFGHASIREHGKKLKTRTWRNIAADGLKSNLPKDISIVSANAKSLLWLNRRSLYELQEEQIENANSSFGLANYTIPMDAAAKKAFLEAALASQPPKIEPALRLLRSLPQEDPYSLAMILNYLHRIRQYKPGNHLDAYLDEVLSLSLEQTRVSRVMHQIVEADLDGALALIAERYPKFYEIKIQSGTRAQLPCMIPLSDKILEVHYKKWTKVLLHHYPAAVHQARDNFGRNILHLSPRSLLPLEVFSTEHHDHFDKAMRQKNHNGVTPIDQELISYGNGDLLINWALQNAPEYLENEATESDSYRLNHTNKLLNKLDTDSINVVIEKLTSFRPAIALLAAEKSDWETVKLCLKLGANELKFKDIPCLAAKAGRTDILYWYLINSPDLLVQPCGSDSLLSVSVDENQPEVAKWLMENTPYHDALDTSLLSNVMRKGYLELAEFILLKKEGLFLASDAYRKRPALNQAIYRARWNGDWNSISWIANRIPSLLASAEVLGLLSEDEAANSILPVFKAHPDLLRVALYDTDSARLPLEDISLGNLREITNIAYEDVVNVMLKPDSYGRPTVFLVKVEVLDWYEEHSPQELDAVDCKGNTRLHFQVNSRKDFEHTVNWYLTHHPDSFLIPNSEGNTAVHLLAGKLSQPGVYDLIKKIAEKLPEAFLVNNSESKTPWSIYRRNEWDDERSKELRKLVRPILFKQTSK